jgi:predicted transcriptional regulator
MSTELKLPLPDDLSEALKSAAEAEGKTIEEVAEAALRVGLKEQSWQELLRYGLDRGKVSGYTEDEVPDIVKDWRKENRRR